jgi:hypothetical protein
MQCAHKTKFFSVDNSPDPSCGFWVESEFDSMNRINVIRICEERDEKGFGGC